MSAKKIRKDRRFRVFRNCPVAVPKGEKDPPGTVSRTSYNDTHDKVILRKVKFKRRAEPGRSKSIVEDERQAKVPAGRSLKQRRTSR